LNTSPNIIRVIKTRRMKWDRHVVRMGEMRNAYNILVGKPEGKRTLGRPKRRWKNNTRMNLRGNRVRRCGLDASGTGLGPVIGSCEHGNEPSGSIKGEELLD
jgi:hypothetical protein